jgi:hypothetical protein
MDAWLIVVLGLLGSAVLAFVIVSFLYGHMFGTIAGAVSAAYEDSHPAAGRRES